jgi:hypothetical protein
MTVLEHPAGSQGVIFEPAIGLEDGSPRLGDAAAIRRSTQRAAVLARLGLVAQRR